MAGRTGRQGSGRNDASVRDLLDRMEPDLRLLEGTVSVLRSLSETNDGVEPVALEAVAYMAGETVERVTSRWREASDVLRGR